jgi:hypothetical protein
MNNLYNTSKSKFFNLLIELCILDINGGNYIDVKSSFLCDFLYFKM